MCGITGRIARHKDLTSAVRKSDLAILNSMTDIMVHRGPDDRGTHVDQINGNSLVSLGFRRLSIVDLNTGHQPMTSSDERYTIVFNGEIYNHKALREELRGMGVKFNTKSDTEVIIESWRKWGKDCFRRFNGMFGFALFDRKDQTLTIARDPFGKKPIFILDSVIEGKPVFAFSSEVESILEIPGLKPELDVSSVFRYLTWRYVPGPDTMFKGIRKLAPGTFLQWKDWKIKEERFWHAPAESGITADFKGDAVAKFREIFRDAVALRLQADVPVGAFLSGGLDSTSVVSGIAADERVDLHTYSAGFLDDENSEYEAAKMVGEFFKTKHRHIVTRPEDLVGDIPKLSRVRGSPVTEPADLPIYRMSLEAAKEVKVVLTGDGADEVFAGYPKHVLESRWPLISALGNLPMAKSAIRTAAKLMPQHSARLGRLNFTLSQPDFQSRMVSWFGSLSNEERDRFWTGPKVLHALDPRPFNSADKVNSLRQILHFDQTSWLPDNMCERMDSMSMAASIEVRSPFLDTRLADFSATLPDDWLIKGKVTKRIVRESMRGTIPDSVLTKKKIGFRMPVADWMRGPLRESFNDQVTGSDSVIGQYIDRKAVNGMMADHMAERGNYEKTLWSLYTLEVFLRQFFK